MGAPLNLESVENSAESDDWLLVDSLDKDDCSEYYYCESKTGQFLHKGFRHWGLQQERTG